MAEQMLYRIVPENSISKMAISLVKKKPTKVLI